MTEKLIFRCEVTTDDAGIVHVKNEPGEKLDLIDVMIARAYAGAVGKITDALKVMEQLGRR